MTLRLPVTSVGSPHDVIAPYMGPNIVHPLPSAAEPLSQNLKVLTFYSGQLTFDFPAEASDEIIEEDVFSYIPYSGGEVQKFGTHRRMRVAAVVTASLASISTPSAVLGSQNSIAAVDQMGAKIKPVFPDEPDSDLALILKLRIAAKNAFIHRISYSVTVNATIYESGTGETITGVLGIFTNPSARWNAGLPLPPTW